MGLDDRISMKQKLLRERPDKIRLILQYRMDERLVLASPEESVGRGMKKQVLHERYMVDFATMIVKQKYYRTGL